MLIEQEKIWLLQAPPLQRNPLPDNDPVFRWVTKHTGLMPTQTRAILETCINAWVDLYSNLREPEWSSAIEAEISETLMCMQMQPSIMDEFRRFVVIKAPKDKHINLERDGVRLMFF
jgi:hypothetical protein